MQWSSRAMLSWLTRNISVKEGGNMTEWKECLLGDLITFQRGHDLSKSKMSGNGYPVVGSNGIIGFHNEYTTEYPSITVGRSGNVGKPYIVYGRSWSHNTSLYIKEFKGTDPIFIYYFLQTLDLGNYAGGSAVPTLNRNHIHSLNVRVPADVSTQEKIANTLKALDDKIDKNTDINKNLLEQVTALYKYRFIELQPFNGTMPDDWHLGTVSEIIELHDSKRIPLSSRERADLAKIYPYYGATSVMDYVDRYLFDGIYLLLGEDGTVVDSKGFPILQYVEGKFWVNNHAHIITGRNGFSVELLYLLFSLTSVQSIVTGAVQPKISQANLNKVPVIIPSEAELKAFDATIQPIFTQIRNLRAENDRLATTRDTLLPKLMSGELDVSDIDL